MRYNAPFLSAERGAHDGRNRLVGLARLADLVFGYPSATLPRGTVALRRLRKSPTSKETWLAIAVYAFHSNGKR